MPSEQDDVCVWLLPSMPVCDCLARTVQLGIASIVSILASLAVSLTVTTALCLYLLRSMKRMSHEDGGLVRKLKAAARRVLAVSLRHPGRSWRLRARWSLTALTAALALVPIALSEGQPGKEIRQPVAVVILGGLLSSTLLDIVVTPAVFQKFGRSSAERWARARNSAGAQADLASATPECELSPGSAGSAPVRLDTLASRSGGKRCLWRIIG